MQGIAGQVVALGPAAMSQRAFTVIASQASSAAGAPNGGVGHTNLPRDKRSERKDICSQAPVVA